VEAAAATFALTAAITAAAAQLAFGRVSTSVVFPMVWGSGCCPAVPGPQPPFIVPPLPCVLLLCFFF